MGKTTYSAKFKAELVLEVLREEKELGEIAAQHTINPNMLRNWKKEFLEKSSMVFDESRRERELSAKERAMESEREELWKTVGQLTLERDWLKKNLLNCLDMNTKKDLVKSNSELTVERQCQLLSLNVSTYYFKPAEKSYEELKRDESIMAGIDKWHTAMPYLGCRKLVTKLLRSRNFITCF